MMNHWHIVSSDAFKKGQPIDGDVYYLSDTREIYRGSVPFTESVIMYTESLPASPAKNRLYINSKTLEGKVWNGSLWTTVIHAISSTVTATAAPVSGSAVTNYVTTEISNLLKTGKVIKSIGWDKGSTSITVTKGDNSVQNVKINGLAASISFSKNTGELKLLDSEGTLLGSAINLDLERFVQSGEYKSDTKEIILYFDKEKKDSIKIPVASLVDTYTAKASNTIDLKVSGNEFTGDVKVSKEKGNSISIKSDGIYAAPMDISGKMDTQETAVNKNIAIFNDKGQVIDSGSNIEGINASINNVQTTVEGKITSAKQELNGSISSLAERVTATEDHLTWKTTM